MECHESISYIYNKGFVEGKCVQSLGVEDNVLEKLRNCSLIPRTLSGFQAFVSSLVSDPISDAVIKEVWRQIYKTYDLNESFINNGKSMNILEESGTKLPMCLRGENHNDMAQLPISISGITKTSYQSDSVLNISRLPITEEEISSVVKSDEETSSIDCEVVEVVSLNKGSSEKCNNLDEFYNECNEPESDKSVEILELDICSSSDEETFCLIHGHNDFKNVHNLTENCEHLNCGSTSERKGFRHRGKEENARKNYSVDDHVKKKRKVKYKKLKTEMKNLKYLLTKLLVNAKGTVEQDDTAEDSPISSKNNLIHKVKRNSRKTLTKEFSEELFSRRKENITISKKKSKEKESKEKESKKKDFTVSYNNFNFASAGKNNPGPSTEPSQEKSPSTSHSKTFHEFFVPSDKIPDRDACSSDTSERKRRKFLWRELIVETLKSNPSNKMTVEKLRRRVISKYYCHRGNISQNTSLKFFRYLHSTAGVYVDAGFAIYDNKQKMQVSSKSEQKKQFVMKTVTTTREYKMT